jgi:CDP-diacylglycerol--serine O-phosphatidyltransferase
MRHLPNALTLLALLVGFSTLGAVLGGAPSLGLSLLPLAMLCDGLAGWLAKRRGRETPIGAELDAVAALMAFGIPVAALAFELKLRALGTSGTVLAVAFAVAGALRLSRDNADHPDWPLYKGLPLPAAGGLLALLSGMDGMAPEMTALAALVLGALMLCPIRWARLPRHAGLILALGILLLSAAAWAQARPLLLAVLSLYTVFGARPAARP